MKPFSLSLSKIKKLNFDHYERDFNFVYCHEVFSCNKFIADFLSPLVQKIRLTDPSIDEFVIPDDQHYPPEIFKEVIKSGEFQEIQITDKNAKALQYFYNKLGNSEFSEYILFNNPKDKVKSGSKSNETINKSSLSVNSVFQQLRIKLAIGICITQETEFIASHLYELNSQMEKEKNILTVDVLQMIFSSPKICLSNEEWLFHYIMKRSEEDKVFLCLFEYVKFSHLSKESVEIFFNKVPVDEMNQSVYNSIIELTMASLNSSKSNKDNISKLSRYYHDPKEKEEEEKKEANKKLDRRVINFDGKNPLNGIFRYLKKNVSNGKNINSDGIVDITSSSISDNDKFSLNHLVDDNFETLFVSKNEPNQTITIDFKNRRVVPNCYTLITNRDGVNGNHMKSWVIEVSNDNKNFTRITSESNNVTLNAPGNLVVFRAFNPQQGRYVRFRQTGPNWHNTDFLALAQIELFGELLEETDV